MAVPPPASLEPSPEPTGFVRGRAGWGLWNLAIDLLGDVCGKTILDVGAGGGDFAKALTDRGAVVTGGDLVDQWQHPSIPFIQMDMDETLPFADGSLDALTIIEAFNYADSTAHLFREGMRVLKPGGVMVVTFPNCLCLESRMRFLLNGSYRWFPHPVYQKEAKPGLADIGRDPVRISTAVFQAERAGMNVERIEYGASRMGLLAALVSGFLRGITLLHNRTRKNPAKRVPDWACSVPSYLHRNVGLRAVKP